MKGRCVFFNVIDQYFAECVLLAGLVLTWINKYDNKTGRWFQLVPVPSTTNEASDCFIKGSMNQRFNSFVQKTDSFMKQGTALLLWESQIFCPGFGGTYFTGETKKSRQYATCLHLASHLLTNREKKHFFCDIT